MTQPLFLICPYRYGSRTNVFRMALVTVLVASSNLLISSNQQFEVEPLYVNSKIYNILTPSINNPIIAPPYSYLLIDGDFYYVYCINDTDLPKITKTQEVGLRKQKY